MTERRTPTANQTSSPYYSATPPEQQTARTGREQALGIARQRAELNRTHHAKCTQRVPVGDHVIPHGCDHVFLQLVLV